MVGIYKFTNRITGESYIGQSKNIRRRYNRHKCTYQLDKKCRENTLFHNMLLLYGFENFDFEVLEECNEDELKDKEIFYISKYNTIYPYGYNISAGGDKPHFIKLNSDDLKLIYDDLQDNILTENQIAKKYNLHPTTISLINMGKMWRDDSRKYPIRQITKKEYYCLKCGAKLWGKCKTNMCPNCYHESQINDNIPDKDTLYNLLLNNSFVKVAEIYNVTDNTIRKWCDKYNIPRHSSYYKKLRGRNVS